MPRAPGIDMRERDPLGLGGIALWAPRRRPLRGRRRPRPSRTPAEAGVPARTRDWAQIGRAHV